MRGRLLGVVDQAQPKPCVRQWTSVYPFSSDGSVGQSEAGNRWTSKGHT